MNPVQRLLQELYITHTEGPEELSKLMHDAETRLYALLLQNGWREPIPTQITTDEFVGKVL